MAVSREKITDAGEVIDEGQTLFPLPIGTPKARTALAIQLPLTEEELLEATAQAGIQEMDPITGEACSPEELRFRMLIHQQGQMGYIAVDANYEALRFDLHKPIIDGESVEMTENNKWELPREGMILQVPVGVNDQGKIAEADIVQMIQYAAGDYAAFLMHHLFAIANDPPYYRRPEIEVNVSTLLDRMGYKRDSRGLHYSTARKRLTKTLLALQHIHIQVVRRAVRQGGKTAGIIAPLLSAVGFVTNEDTQQMSLQDIFAQGLPAVVRVHINPVWYGGVRQMDGRPGTNYRLLPRPTAVPTGGHNGPVRRGRRSKTIELLRPWLENNKATLNSRWLTINKAALLQIANITNKNVTMANKTLTDALDRLCEDGHIIEFDLQGTSIGDMVRIKW